MRKSIFLRDGDIELVNGNIVLVSGPDRVRQLIENALSIRRGEWFYNTTTGLNHEQLFKKKPDIENLKDDIIECVTRLEEVTEVSDIEIEFNRQERTAKINFTAIYNLENIEVEVNL